MGMQATYHSKKIYVPDEIAKKLSLKDGDKVEYFIRGEDMVELKINRRKSSKELLLKEIKNARPLGIRSKLHRKEIYEDID
ncbi:MAG: hypothetical protein OK457_01575 [Thaumarchaeota archaeon]|nr:hypothetical protein [Nitrososphaerota archaeon]